MPEGGCLQPKHVAGNNGNKKSIVVATECILTYVHLIIAQGDDSKSVSNFVLCITYFLLHFTRTNKIS